MTNLSTLQDYELILLFNHFSLAKRFLKGIFKHNI